MAGMADGDPPLPPAAAHLVALADQCVKCGLCLPHCPTYRVGEVEAESPRGRIALARGLASGAMAPSSALVEHLDQCLACLSCQVVCPSGVRYGELIEGIRADMVERRLPPRHPSWLHDPGRLVALARLGALLRAGRWLPRLARLLPRGSVVRRLAATQPDLPRPLHLPTRAPAASRRGTVALFRGCVASVYDADTLAAARCLLEAAGHRVVETPASRCCGALPRHAGEVLAADRHAAATRDALLASGARVVLTSASGCHGDLRDHVATGGKLEVLDIHAFLAADEGFAALRFRPLAARAALHLPCTQLNVVGDAAPIRALLGRIPALEVQVLPLHPRCCGAAGSYFIEHPAIADALQAEKLAQAAAFAPDLLLTTNIGCRIHLGNGLRARGTALPLRHPLALLAAQLDNRGHDPA
jgi:glycolate oxidase iron-sulfur subunit